MASSLELLYLLPSHYILFTLICPIFTSEYYHFINLTQVGTNGF